MMPAPARPGCARKGARATACRDAGIRVAFVAGDIGADRGSDLGFRPPSLERDAEPAADLRVGADGRAGGADQERIERQAALHLPPGAGAELAERVVPGAPGQAAEAGDAGAHVVRAAEGAADRRRQGEVEFRRELPRPRDAGLEEV